MSGLKPNIACHHTAHKSPARLLTNVLTNELLTLHL